MNIKTRVFPESNYKGIYHNHKTLRIALDPTKPITELKYPEFYDVDIFETMNGLCRANCPWCYLKGNVNGKCVEDAAQRITNYFGQMTENQRPFQVAIPGSGELFEHPDWYNILKAFHDLGIVPNYTTNGMFSQTLPNETISDALPRIKKILSATQEFCGGVAVSCHPHLNDSWGDAADFFYNAGIKLNFHNIISDRKSIDTFIEIYDTWEDKVDYFVLLPHGNQGRAEGANKTIDWEYLVSKLPEDQSKLAFGANFYPYLLEGKHNIKVSLYEPEIMSKFLSLDKMELHNSSFSLNKVELV
jgi:organic radical activating enzyme